MKKIILSILLLHSFSSLLAQAQTENVIVISFDGFRWQELFDGADDSLINNKNFTSDSATVRKKYWAETVEEKRKKLLPFIWSTIGKEGQIHGNRLHGSQVNVKNKFWFSYPGYNEIFTGYPDTLVNSNDKKDNNNITVLEFLNEQPSLKGKVAAFTSWDVFDAILNEKRSGLTVSAGFDVVSMNSPRFALLNEMQKNSFQLFGEGVRPDMLTYYIAREYIKEKKPKLVYIGFDETDDFAHGGKYDHYLDAANLTDRWIEDLWNTIQSMPEYRNKTTLIITTDHGRGDLIKKEWTSHGTKIKGADEIWMAFLGNGISPLGEVKKSEQLYQAQVAQTIANLLGFTYKANHPIEKAVPFISQK